MYLLKISQYSEILTPKKYRRKKPTVIDWEQCLHVKMKKKFMLCYMYLIILIWVKILSKTWRKSDKILAENAVLHNAVLNEWFAYNVYQSIG